MKIIVNNKLCNIICDDKDLLKRIRLLLSYEVKGAFFSPAYRMGRWDGRVYLFDVSKTIHIGLLHRLLYFLQLENIPYTIEDKRTVKQNFKLEYLDEGRVLYKDGKKDIKLRYYQREGILEYLKPKFGIPSTRGIFELPPRSGKTLMTGTLGLVLNEYPIMFIVHKIDLAYQTKKVFEKLYKTKIGIVGDGNFDINSKIIVTTIQSLCQVYDIKMKKLKDSFELGNEKTIKTDEKIKFKKFIETIKVVMSDECFLKNTKILINKNEWVTIGEIYNNKKITEVLSYNELTKQLEQKKIVRKIMVVNGSQLYKIKIKINGKIKELKCTYNHKIWTDKGYVQAQDIKKGDIIKYLENFDNSIPVYICKLCGEKFNNNYKYGSHINCKHTDKGGYCKICNKSFNGIQNHLAYHKNPLLIDQMVNNIDYKNVVKKRIKNPKYWESMKQMGLRRTGKNNPVHKKGTKEKISLSLKKTFANQTKEFQLNQITRFMNAPKFRKKINKPESIINNLNFEDLLYAGDGKKKEYIYKIKDYKKVNEFRNKIPDFIVKNQKKVIEVADREYWHTEEEMKLLKLYYDEIGIKCLIIYSDELKNLEQIKNRIYTFINNHDVEVLECEKDYITTQNLYNLEIEDNHNYFANGILVSNCHITGSEMFTELPKYLKGMIYGIGCSGTPYREDNADIMIEQLWGSIVYSYTREQGVKDGFLLPMKIYFVLLPAIKISSTDYQTAKSEGLNKNKYIPLATDKLLKRHKKKNMSTVIIVKEKAQGNLIHKQINCNYLHGKIKGKERARVYGELNSKNIKEIISTVTDIGVDIPTLDSVIIASPSKSKVSALQRLRSGTPSEGKKYGYVFILCPQIDTNDKNYLEEHWKKLMNFLKKEKTFAIEIIKYEDL